MKPLEILLIKAYARVHPAIVGPPLGLLYIASHLAARGRFPYRLRILDLSLNGRNMDGLSAEAIRERLQSMPPPDIVGVSALSVEAGEIDPALRIVKERNPRAKLIVGGPVATSKRAEVFNMIEGLDFAVVNEGEEVFTRLCERIARDEDGFDGLPGLIHRARSGEIVENPPGPPIEDLDGLPFPAWKEIRLADYSAHYVRNMIGVKARKIYAPLFTSRGCPFNCVYCHAIFGRRFRARSPENVIQEMEQLCAMGVGEFQIYDDIFNFDRDRVLEICARIRREKLDIRLSFPNGLRTDLLDREVIDALVDAGAYYMIFAVETASPRLQRFTRKRIDLEKAKEMIEHASRRNIITKSFFMIGFPTETIEEIEETIRFAARSPLTLAVFFTVTPQENTELFEMIKKDFDPGLAHSKADPNYYYSTHSFYQRAYGIDLEVYKRKALRTFYLNPKRMWRIFRLFPNKRDLFKGLYVVHKFLRSLVR